MWRTDGAEEWADSVRWDDRPVGGGDPPAAASAGPRVLCKDDGTPITRQGAWSRVRYAAKRAKVPTGVHILRHTFCSHLAMQGAPMRGVQELVGHQSLAMTQRYSHLTPAALEATIRLLETARRCAQLETVWRRRRSETRNVDG